jgi:DNA-binding transcriptional regulator YiaG
VSPRRFEPDKYAVPQPPGEDCERRDERHDHDPHHRELSGPVYPPTGQCGPVIQPDIELYDLIDYSMPVGNTGIVFVAGLTGFRESDGTAQFITGAVAAAYRRAASTLAQMALVSGPTFQFMRLAENLSTAQAAALAGVSESEVTDWEDGTTPVPPSSWQSMADYAAQQDMRAGITWTALPAVNLRPRTIRVYPDVPYAGQILPRGPDCPPCR